MKAGKPIQARALFDGAKLRELRIGRNMSAVALASLVQASDESILSWEKGRNRPSAETVFLLARVFHVRPSLFRTQEIA